MEENRIHPNWDTIYKLKQKPTNGELHLLKFLDKYLDEHFEIFFQSNIDGVRPDIVIMKEGSGVLIIEVKDWDLNYYINYNGEWRVSNNGTKTQIRSPFYQVNSYKDKLFNLNIPDLLEKKIKNPKTYAIVGCAIYFHKTTKNKLKEFIKNEKKNKYIQAFTKEELTKEFLLNKLIPKYYLNKQSNYFDKKTYDEFYRKLKPTFHTLSEGIDIRYSKEQQILIKSQNVQQKIKGIAGSGKTIVLAKRAVNAYRRTNDKVLILYYNLKELYS